MTEKTILVLGGYGGAGSAISRAILKNTRAGLIVAGRSDGKARALAEKLNREFSGNRASWAFADAADRETLREPFGRADLVIVAATTTSFVETTAKAAIEAGSDYLDIHYPQKVASALEGLAPDIERAGLTFVTQAGFHPGLPSVFVRRSGSYFTRYRKASAAVAMKTDFDPGGAVLEFVDTLSDYSAEVFKDGEWRRAGYRDVRKVDFGPPLGTKTCYPTTLAEMTDLPERLGIEELAAYVAGLNWFVDYVVTPLAFVLGKVKKGLGRDQLAWLMVWGSKRFTSPGEAVTFVLEAEGEKDGKSLSVKMTARHDDVYEFTAMPVGAFLSQYLDGSLKTPGIWMMGHLVDPERFVEDLERMGAKVEVEVEVSEA
jgi:hypothetical protein